MRILLFFFGLGLSVFVHANSDLTSQQDQFSYTLGYNFAKTIEKNFGQQNVTVNPIPFSQGIQDGLAKSQPALTPEHMSRILNDLQQQLAQERAKDVEIKAAANYEQLFGDLGYPSEGSPHAPITIVEFFDYQCLHCKNFHKVLQQLRQQHDNIRIVYRDFPILGPISQHAAKVATAARLQDKYLPLHHALLNLKNPLTKQKIKIAAQEEGLDLKKLEQDLQHPSVVRILKNNFNMASSLGIDSAPAVLIAKTLDKAHTQKGKVIYFRGEQPLKTMEQAIKNMA